MYMYLYIHVPNSVITSMVYKLTSCVVDHEFRGFILKTIKFVFADSQPCMQLYGVRARTGWL